MSMSAATLLQSLQTRNRNYKLISIVLFCIIFIALLISRQHLGIRFLKPSRLPVPGRHSTFDDCLCKDRHSKQAVSMCYSSSVRIGRSFGCKSLTYLNRLRLLATGSAAVTVEPTVDATQRDVIFATAASSNHFDELLGLIASTQTQIPSAQMVVYDLGLNPSEKQLVKRLCNVNFRRFEFREYPKFVRNLAEYRWKPLIIAEMLKEFEQVWWMDTSVRWMTMDISTAYQAIDNHTDSPYLLVDHTGHSIFAATNPAMLSYLPANPSRLRRTEMMGATLGFIRRSPKSTQLLKWLTLCALEKHCMAPKNSILACNFNKDRWNRYGNCHRFDQSAVNLLLAEMYDYNTTKYTLEVKGLATVKRGSTNDGVTAKRCR